MPRQCWPFQSDVPVMQVTFERADRSGTLTKVLQVDSGATGGGYAFSLGQDTCLLAGLAGDADVSVRGVSGQRILRPTVWLIATIPAINLRCRVLAVCYPRAPGNFDGLVRLPFLSHYFEKWGGERDTTGQWQFCVER